MARTRPGRWRRLAASSGGRAGSPVLLAVKAELAASAGLRPGSLASWLRSVVGLHPVSPAPGRSEAGSAGIKQAGSARGHRRLLLWAFQGPHSPKDAWGRAPRPGAWGTTMGSSLQCRPLSHSPASLTLKGLLIPTTERRLLLVQLVAEGDLVVPDPDI